MLVIASPWLQGGYLFGTDWPGPRRFDWPTALSSSAPLQAILAATSRVLSAELTGKLFVVAILFVAGQMAYRAVPADGFVPRAAGAVVYVFNPFVFGRMHYGQLYLLAGYAALPWVAIRFRALGTRPRLREAVIFAVSMALTAVFSLHLFLVASVMTLAVLTAAMVAADGRIQYLRLLVIPLAVACAMTLALCSYWVLPLLMGRGAEAAVIAGTGSGQLDAYAAVPDPQFGLAPNLLGLYGFWAEDTGRFTSMKAFVTPWPVVLIGLLLVCGVGTVSAFRKGDRVQASWVAGLIVAAVVALFLEMGVSNPLSSGFVHWLDSTFPVYRGMRDAGKWAALLALVYSQLFGLGAWAILEWIRRLKMPANRVEWLGAAAIGLLITVPLYYGNGLLFGMHGEIKPSQYPAGWYAADRALSSDPHPGRALFLPWHEYMRYRFVQNQNQVIAPPGPSFFSVPLVVSSDPEIPGVVPPDDPDQLAISSLTQAGANGDWAATLAARGIRYILLAREVDWQSYDYLSAQPGLVEVGDYGSIVLYRNERGQ
jgi:hypothetical protein